MLPRKMRFVCPCLLSLLGSLNIPYSSAENDHVRIRGLNERTSDQSSDDIYWDLSCPWEMTHLSVQQRFHTFFDDPDYLSRPNAQTREEFIRSAEESREYSLLHHTPERFRNNAGALQGRRTVIVGDSLSRQLFVSMACLIPEQMIASHATPWTFHIEHAQEFFDSRIHFKASGDLFYSPRAGEVNDYNWVAKNTGGWAPIQSPELDWIRSCHEKKPFQFTSYFIPQTDENDGKSGFTNMEYNEGDQEFETITLNKDDVVIISAGVHIPRPENLSGLEELLDCMDKVQNEEGKEMDWPHITYFKTSMKHYADHKIDGHFFCEQSNHHKEHEEYEIETFGNRVHMFGKNFDYSDLGNLHVNAKTPDCTHWLQPGLPDLQAVEVVEYLGSLDEKKTSH